MKTGTYVVVTTEKRGVFGGILQSADDHKKTCALTHARVCVHWSAATKGFLGLASIGPQPGSRISPAVPTLELNEVTSISEVTAEARKLWESAPWN